MKALAGPALRHRVLLSPAAEIEGRTTDSALKAILDQIEAPDGPMIAPTSRAIVLAALGAPLSLVLATLVAPNLWPLGAAWALAIAVLVLVDGVLAPPPSRTRVGVAAPAAAPIGAGAVRRAGAPAASPAALQARLK